MRKFLAATAVISGTFFIITYQLWGSVVMQFVGFERALGAANVQRLDDGTVLLTNPLGMFLWSCPFLVLGAALFYIGIRAWRSKPD